MARARSAVSPVSSGEGASMAGGMTGSKEAARSAEPRVVGGNVPRHAPVEPPDQGVGPGRSAPRAELRSSLLQSACMVAGAGQGDPLVGWRHADPRILQAQGQRSAPLVSLWAEHVFPGLEGLLERLEGSDGAFLDVGVGVAALPIGMCHRFPRLRAVGVDPLEPALVEARRNIEAAQLADRIDLRAARFEPLEEDSAYDLIHIPTMFAPAQMLPGWFERARRALRPGGWVLLQMLDRRGDGLRQAVLGLWTTLWGGGVLLPEQAQGMLADAAYERTGVVPSMPGPPVVHVGGRRPLT